MLFDFATADSPYGDSLVLNSNPGWKRIGSRASATALCSQCKSRVGAARKRCRKCGGPRPS